MESDISLHFTLRIQTHTNQICLCVDQINLFSLSLCKDEKGEREREREERGKKGQNIRKEENRISVDKSDFGAQEGESHEFVCV